MALPNYSPSGTILFGSVPWSNDYSNVRLYTSLSEQEGDVSSLMTVSSGNYAYIARERRLKVDIEADRLYHCNYCMYRNASLTDGWIYCFVSNVTYVNDNTTEITLETDVFQTYLYSVDWTVPACFVERMTAPEDTEDYMYADEPSFPLTYIVDGREDYYFEPGGWVILSAAEPVQNQSIIDDVLNPGGWYADPIGPNVTRGIANGCGFYFIDYIDNNAGGVVTEELETFLNGMQSAGSVDSIVSIFTVPEFYLRDRGWQQGWLDISHEQESPTYAQEYFARPSRGDAMDGYTPRNNKLLYWPYTFCRLSDWNGSHVDLRYELMYRISDDGSHDTGYRIAIKYEPSATCEARVYPEYYNGIVGTDFGIVAKCGAQGSYTNDMWQQWLAQNAGNIALEAVGTVATVAAGGVAIGAATKSLGIAGRAAHATKASRQALIAAGESQMEQGISDVSSGLLGGGSAIAGAMSAMHTPTQAKGNTAYNADFMGGLQGVHAMRMVVKSEIAEMIDDFFDQFGYEIDRIVPVDVTSRPSWNYVKTSGCGARSTNVGAGTGAPFARGRGTPADALSVIKRQFDGGVTFWHTTSGFGDYSLANK